MQNPLGKSNFNDGSIGASAKYKLPYAGNCNFAISLTGVATDLTHSICWSVFIMFHFSCSWIPEACSIIMYSVPVGLVGSSFQSRTLGIGIEV